MNQEKIGKFIKELRIKNNLTQAEFAKKLNVTYQAVSKWERGISVPDIGLLKEISKIFNVNVDEILDGQKKKKRKWIIFLILIIIIILIFIISYKNNNNFEMKEIKTTCENFNVSGSVGYSNDKTTIIISDISFCDEDNNIYDSISAILYEKDGNKKITLSKDSSGKNTTLSNYIKKIKFKVEHTTTNCKMFTSSEIYIVIKAVQNNKTTSYKIPLELDDNCEYASLN